MFLFKIFIAVVLVEAITELIVKSEFFSFFRKLIFKSKIEFLDYLINCGYCMSVWIGWFAALLLQDHIYITGMFFIDGLLLHRLSNFWHFIIDYFRDARIR